MDIGSILSKTWNITWKFKGLWILGILGGCSASGRGGGGAQAPSGFQGYQFDPQEFRRFGFEGVEPGLEDFFNNIAGEAWLAFAVGIVLVVIALALLFLALGVIGQGGLIAGFGRADGGEAVTLGQAFGWGMENFWRLLGIRLVIWLAGLIIGGIFIVAAVVLGALTLGIGLICFLPLICLVIPLALAVDAYVILAMVAAVEEGAGVFEAFSLAWNTVKENVGNFVVMTLILVIGGGIVSFIIGLPILAVVAPAALGFIFGTEETLVSGLALSGLCLVLAIPVIILLNGILTTFTTGAWTLTYRRLNGKAGTELAA